MFLVSYTGRHTALNTTISGLIMAVNYIICAGALCFSYGPATTTGNKYYSTWSGVFLSLSLVGGAPKEHLITRGSGVTSSSATVSETNALIDEV